MVSLLSGGGGEGGYTWCNSDVKAIRMKVLFHFSM